MARIKQLSSTDWRNVPAKQLGPSATVFRGDLIQGDVAFKQLSAYRKQHVADAAYFKSEARGFVPGHELDDWLAAERDIDDAVRFQG